jgi:hypothetical protein
MRECINYCVLNQVTINWEDSFLKTDNLFSQLLGALVFSEIDSLLRFHTHTVQKGNVDISVGSA